MRNNDDCPDDYYDGSRDDDGPNVHNVIEHNVIEHIVYVPPGVHHDRPGSPAVHPPEQ